MFDKLSGRLSGIFDKLRGRGALSESDVHAAMREIRLALLEADVALPVAKDFIARVTERAIGAEVMRSVTPGQQVVKIVHDALVEMLGSADDAGLALAAAPPVAIMLVGLQGAGKTTTAAKLALRLRRDQGKKVMMCSLDVHRPAAQEQLRLLGEQADIATLPIISGQMPRDIAQRGLQAARLQGVDVVLFDTAGRLHVDDALMDEMRDIADLVTPAEILLVADSLTGQDAVNVAAHFAQCVALSGVILTRMDGDARGGAALSMRTVTKMPIKFVGVGEKLDALEAFDPDRVANRILGMGDVVGLVERAREAVSAEDNAKMAARMAKGAFDLNDLRTQLAQMKKMGGVGALLGMLPGLGKMRQQAEAAGVDDRKLDRMEAIILSMTPQERAHPNIVSAKRKIRVANGSGVTVQDVNKVLKMHKEMSTAMKRMRKMGGLKSMLGLLGQGQGQMPPGMPSGMGAGMSNLLKRK